MRKIKISKSAREINQYSTDESISKIVTKRQSNKLKRQAGDFPQRGKSP
jgi:hypothetical protein